MNIHPLWFVCISVRTLLVLFVYFFSKQKYVEKWLFAIFAIIGLGFLYKTLTGSNNETQIAKVFWHETRLIHSMLYLLTAYYLFQHKTNIACILLVMDIVFSISYRVVSNQ
jgi:hypothetical protein